MQNLKLAVKVLLALIAYSRPCEGYEVLYAVNIGGGKATTSNGIEFLPDPQPSFHNGSKAVNHGLSGSVPYADGRIFQTARVSHEPFTYEAPVTYDGKYLLVLKFQEDPDSAWSNKEQRQVSVDVNGLRLVDSMDIFSENCIEVQRMFVVKLGNLHYQGDSTSIAQKKVHIRFSRGRSRREVMVSGILLVRLDADELFPKKSWYAHPKSCSECENHIMTCLKKANSNSTMTG
jgi:Malectin domain